MMQAQQLIGASALVGRTVTYQDAQRQPQTGVVTKTKLNGDSEPTLVVGNTDVQLSKVTEVQQAAGATPAATTSPAPVAATPAAATPTPAAGAKPAEQTATENTASDSSTTKEI